MLNWEKCHIMVQEGIVLCHRISEKRIELDKIKVEFTDKLPSNLKAVRSFLGHVGLYRPFKRDFSKIAKLLSNLLMKDVPFDFFQDYLQVFETLKKKLTTASIIVVPDWNLPFELMCDASDFALGVVLGQR